MALLEDVPLCALDPANWSLHFHWPWARQAAAEGDMEKLLPHYKHFLRSMVRYVQEIAQQAKLDCEYRDNPSQSPSPFPWVPSVSCSPLRRHLCSLTGRDTSRMGNGKCCVWCSTWLAGWGGQHTKRTPQGSCHLAQGKPSAHQGAATKFTGAAGPAQHRPGTDKGVGKYFQGQCSVCAAVPA